MGYYAGEVPESASSILKYKADILKDYAPALHWLVFKEWAEKPFYNCDDCPLSQKLSRPSHGSLCGDEAPDVHCLMLEKNCESKSPICSGGDWRNHAVKELAPVFDAIEKETSLYERTFMEIQKELIKALQRDTKGTIDIPTIISNHTLGRMFERYCTDRIQSIMSLAKSLSTDSAEDKL